MSITYATPMNREQELYLCEFHGLVLEVMKERKEWVRQKRKNILVVKDERYNLLELEELISTVLMKENYTLTDGGMLNDAQDVYIHLYKKYYGEDN